MIRELWNALKSRISGSPKAATRTVADREKQNENSARPVATQTARAVPLQNNGSNKGGPIALGRLMALHNAAREKNSGPAQAKMRGFDRTRVTQLRIKRYTRAR
jgi:hypothetical protein